MNLYCVHLSAINPKTGERQRLVINDVPAEHGEEARDSAARRLSEAQPELDYTSVEFIRAVRTDDAWWNRA